MFYSRFPICARGTCTINLVPYLTLLDKIKDPEERLFYIQNTIKYGWSRNVMVMQIELNLHNRKGKAVTNFKDKLPSPQSDLTHNTH